MRWTQTGWDNIQAIMDNVAAFTGNPSTAYNVILDAQKVWGLLNDSKSVWKLEKNFYNTLNDIRDFESRLAPDVMTLFEKRNNGYQYDRTYTSNHEMSIEGDPVPSDLAPAEPHYLQSQIAADYSDDVEESVGTAEDYLKYKNF